MRRHILIAFLVALPYAGAVAQEPGKSLASTLDVFVFPANGQAADQQSKDEAECYNWAVGNTGSDPFDLKKQGEQQAEQTEQQVAQAKASTQGAGAQGAVRGAAAGAVIGEIADDDAGKGAAYGAAAGAIAARRHSRAASHEAQEQAREQGAAKQQATAEQTENFKKAFSVCLEAKEYMIRY